MSEATRTALLNVTVVPTCTVSISPQSDCISVISEFTIPATSFALDRAFETAPTLTIEIERLATHCREWIMPFLWVRGDDISAIEDAFQTDPSIDDVEKMDCEHGFGQFKNTLTASALGEQRTEE